MSGYSKLLTYLVFWRLKEDDDVVALCDAFHLVAIRILEKVVQEMFGLCGALDQEMTATVAFNGPHQAPKLIIWIEWGFYDEKIGKYIKEQRKRVKTELTDEIIRSLNKVNWLKEIERYKKNDWR